MQAKEFERRLAELIGVPHSDIEQRGRKLREFSLLPKGGHGPYAPHIGPEHASFYVLSCVSRRATAGGEVAVRAASLRPAISVDISIRHKPSDNTKRVPLWLFLTDLLLDPAVHKGHRLAIDEDGSFALFEMSWGVQPLPFVADPGEISDVEAMYLVNSYERRSISRQLNIGAEVLGRVAEWIDEDRESNKATRIEAGAGSIQDIQRVVGGIPNRVVVD